MWLRAPRVNVSVMESKVAWLFMAKLLNYYSVFCGIFFFLVKVVGNQERRIYTPNFNRRSVKEFVENFKIITDSKKILA